MIYHISFPHHPFLERSLKLFEKYNKDSNKVILITNASNEDNHCEIANEMILYKGGLNTDIINVINDSECTGVFLYWLNDDLLELSLKIDIEKPIYWRSYGPDLQDIIYKNCSFYERETKKLLSDFLLFDIIKDIIRPIYRIITGYYKKKRIYLEKKIKFLNRINYIGTVTDYEYEQIKKKYLDFNAPKIFSSFTFFTELPKIDDSFKDKIMIGNSSFPLHNHADIFKILSKMKFNSSRLIVPLSYGNKNYANRIIKLGYKLFKDRFCPLTTYLIINDYNNIIESCGTFISNSKVQQAGANINYFLLNGGKVYLHEKNPIYLDRKKQGFRIFSVQKDLTYSHLYNYKLSISDKLKNRDLILNLIYSNERISFYTKKIIQVLGG